MTTGGDPRHLRDLFLPPFPPVPIYVRPRTVIATTLACTGIVAGIGVAAFEVVSRATWRALNTSPKYGHSPKETP